MPIERYCTFKDCPGGDDCKNPRPGRGCVYEYVAADLPENCRWKGEGPPPSRWAGGGGIVYRSFADYCD
jgi:hypothetical protein